MKLKTTTRYNRLHRGRKQTDAGTRHCAIPVLFLLLLPFALLPVLGHAAAQDGARALACGDTVRLSLKEDPDLTFEGEISATGTIPVPYLGEFRLAGKRRAQVETELAETLRQNLYEKATVSIVLLKRAPGKVYVYGAVQKPGCVEMPQIGEFSPLQVISRVGGLTRWADSDAAYILRRGEAGDREKIPLNLAELFVSFENAEIHDLQLQDGDVLCVPGRNKTESQFISTDPSEVFVVGQVETPGIVRFAPGEESTLVRAIFKAGGFSKFAKTANVRLIRIGDNPGQRQETVLNVASILEEGRMEKDLKVESGDMIIVPQKMLNF